MARCQELVADGTSITRTAGADSVSVPHNVIYLKRKYENLKRTVLVSKFSELGSMLFSPGRKHIHMGL